MKKYFKKLLSYSVYRKTLLAYSISILVITMLILASMCEVFIVNIKQNSIESTHNMLTQLVREVDNLKTDVDNVMAVITNDSKTLKFIQCRDESKMDNYYLFLELKEMKTYYSYIVDISVINFNNGSCIQANGIKGSGTDNIKFAASMIEQQKYIDVRFVKQTQKARNVVSFLQYLPYYNAAVIVDVNADWFQYSINEKNRESRSVYIIDDSGRAVTNNTRVIKDNQSLSDYFYSTISKQDNQRKSFVYDDKSKRQLVFFSESSKYGWWFIDVQDYSYFNSKFQKISVTFIGIALLMVFFCSLISVVFTKKIRKPLVQLANQCKKMLGSEAEYEEDELKYLDIAIARGKHEKYLNENYIKTLYLYNLMTGVQMPLYVPQKELANLQGEYQANYYCVLLMKLQNLDPIEEAEREKEYKIYRYAVCNLAEEIFGNGFTCKAVDMGAEYVGLLFFLERKIIAGEYVLCFKQLKDFAEKTFHITISGSLGLVVSNMMEIFESYQTARQYHEVNQLIGREELIDANNQVSISYQEKNKKLVESILEYTEYNFNNPELSLKSISQIFGLSTTYLGKIFRSIQGEPYSSYVTNYRLEKSKVVLLQTSKTVNDIAIELGFTNSTYYATLFKKTYGLTPTAFRSKQCS